MIIKQTIILISYNTDKHVHADDKPIQQIMQKYKAIKKAGLILF
ncbi:hypothetical protein [Fructobacillus tropaeoli]|nr:hypothetical protein [Fructobacillus tropaeoli]